MKKFVVLLLIIYGFSCQKDKSKVDLSLECITKSDPMPTDEDVPLIEWCTFRNHLFTKVGTPDYKGRLSYEYSILSLKDADTIAIKNSDFFNEKQFELEKRINVKLKEDFGKHMEIADIQDCMKLVDFRYYQIDEFGVSFYNSEEIQFHIDYNIGSACMNVGGATVSFKLQEIAEYLR